MKKISDHSSMSSVCLVFFFISMFSMPVFGVDDLPEIVKRGVIRAAVIDTETPPFLQVDRQGNYYGLEAELINEVASRLGIKAEYVVAPDYNALPQMVADEKADIALSLMSRTLTRAQKVVFTKPYITLHYAMLVNRLEFVKHQKKDMSEMNFVRNYDNDVVCMAGTSDVDGARQMFPNAKILEAKSPRECFELVKTGAVPAYFADHVTIRMTLSNFSGSSIFMHSFLFCDTNDHIAIAVNAKSPHLLYWLNLYLDENQEELDRMFGAKIDAK